MLLYKNAVPWTYYAGVNDKPRAGVAGAVFQASPHTLFNMLMAPWGEVETPIAIAAGSDATRHFGDDIFELGQPFYNYQSVLAEWIGKQGTPQYISRMKLPGMKKSNVRMFMQLVEHSFPIYERGLGGVFKRDENDDKIPTDVWVDGYKYRFVVKNIETDFALGNGEAVDPVNDFTGKKVVRGDDGAVADPKNPTFEDTKGIMLPIYDQEGRYFGKLGDRILSELFAPLENDAVPARSGDIKATGQMMYRMGHALQAKRGGGNSPIYGVNGDMHIDFALKPKTLNGAGTPVAFNDVYTNKYTLSEQIYTGANISAPCSVHMYDDNIALILGKFHEAEMKAKALDVNYPCWINDDEEYSINLFESQDYRGVPYHALEMAPITEQPVDGYHSPLQDSRFAMKFGADGDTSDKAYNAAVKEFCDNVEHKFEIHDMMQYQMGWVYDMGLSTETTKSLYRLMGKNPSLIVVAATEENGVAPKNVDDTSSTAIALDSAYGLYPESSIYKTAPTRGAIVPYAVKIKNHKYREPVPLTFSLAKKMNDYLGVATKIWDPAKDPMLETNKGIDETLLNFVSLDLNLRTKFWETQLVIVETIQHEVRGFTGAQTINPNDSSVLNNLLVVAAVGQAVRAGYEAGVVFRGQTAAPSVIAQRHEERILAECNGIDPSKATVAVRSHQTADDYNASYAITDTITVSGYQAITAVTLELNTQFAEE